MKYWFCVLVVFSVVFSVVWGGACTSYPDLNTDVALNGIYNTNTGKKYTVLSSVEKTNQTIIKTFIHFRKRAEVSIANFSQASENLYNLVAARDVPTQVVRYPYDKTASMVFVAVYPTKHTPSKKAENPVHVYLWVSAEKGETANGVARTQVRILIDRGDFSNSKKSFALSYDEDSFIAEVKKRIQNNK